MQRIIINYVFVVLVLSNNVQALPLSANTTKENSNRNENPADSTTSGPIDATNIDKPIMQTSGSSNAANIESSGVPDNVAAASNYNPSVYAGILTPEALQQYVNQFGATYAPYPAYPAPVGYSVSAPQQTQAAALYPSPIIVQTGYEGFLMPTTATTAGNGANTGTAAAPTTNPFAFLSNILSTLMMSTIFRIVATIVSAIGMAFFGSAIINAICNLTSICDVSSSAMTFLKREATPEGVGRIIAEEMTPERVRRTAEFVRNALRKYHELQQIVGENNKTD